MLYLRYENSFNLNLDGITFAISSMNVTGPILFQLWLPIDEKDTRFHMQGNGIDPLEFVLGRNAKFLLDMEIRLSEMIFEVYPPANTVQS